MKELKWIQTSLLLTALLQFAAAGQVKRVTFRVGEDATLSCGNVIQGQQKYEYTTWYFADSGNPAVELITLGQVGKNSGVRSDRLRVTEDCSLFIKKITEEDAGRYHCKQFISGRITSYSIVHLFVTQNITPPKTTTTTTTATTTTTTPAKSTATRKAPENKVTTGTIEKTPADQADPYARDWRWWLIILVAVVVFIVLLVVVVKVIRRKGNRTQMSDDVELTSDPAGSRSAAGTSQDTADPEGGVSYASIRHNKKGRSGARVCGKDDADDGSVTYASVKPSSSSAAAAAAGASADPSSLYATINKEKK